MGGRSTLVQASVLFFLIVVLLAAPAGTFGDEQAKKPIDAQRAFRKAVLATTSFAVEKMPLRDALKMLSAQQGITIRIDEEAVKKAEISLDSPVTVKAENYKFTALVRLLLRDDDLRFEIEGESLVVTATSAEPQPVEDVYNQLEVLEWRSQFENQYRAILRLELQFVEKVCQLDAQQARQLQDEGEQILTKVASSRARPLHRQDGRTFLWEPINQIRSCVHAAAQGRLTPAQSAVLVAELNARKAEDIQGTVAILVSRVDDVVTLTAEQRNAMLAGLADGAHLAWFTSYDSVWSSFTAADLPTSVLRPYLNDTQILLWESTKAFVFPRIRQWGSTTWMIDLQAGLLVDAPPVHASNPEGQAPQRRQPE